MWYYNGEPFTKQPPKDAVGFCYEIFEKDSGMMYIGIKRFWKTVKYPPLKGKKNKRHKIVETDWRTYNTSSPIMQSKLHTSPNNYDKILVRVCYSVTELKAYEAYMQLKYYINGNWNVLYNEVINLRMRVR